MEITFAASIACLVADFGRKYYAKWRPFVVGAIATGSLLITLAIVLMNWGPYSSTSTGIQPIVVPFASLYVINSFTTFIIFTAVVIGIIVSVYSWTFLSAEDNAGPFFAVLLLLLLSVIGVASAGDFLTLFLFWECMSISAYGLVAFNKDSALSLEASLKYIFLAGVGSLLALYGISLVYSTLGTIQISAIGTLFSSNSEMGVLALLFIILGFGVEAAIFPLHTWLPDVYSAAPTPVSAIVSGIVTETGIFVLLKIVQPFVGITGLSATGNLLNLTAIQDVQLVLAALAVMTMLVGNLGGYAQSNLKRLLAYSSIAQMGYMLAALSTFTLAGLVAVVFNIWNHGIVKSGFFLEAGGKSYEETDLSNLQGLGQQNKVVGVMFASSSLAIVGSPPFGMFWSELFMVYALIAKSSTPFLVLGAIVVLNIFLSIGYYIKIINRIVLNPPPEGKITQKISISQLIPPMAFLALSLASGLLPFLLLSHIT